MHDENLNSSKKLFFTALWIDIAVTAIVAMSAFFAIYALKEIQSGALTYSQSLGDSLQFWENFATLTILTLIGVGLALVKWLNSCYRYAKESIGANGFKNEGWTAWAWIVPFINLFKPYQIINEIYKAGAPRYRNPDDWKKESGSGLLLTWWIFWVASHLFMVVAGKVMLSKAPQDDPTIPQALVLLNLQIGVCVLSIVIAVMWFFVANHLTGRLLGRQRLSNDGMGKSMTTPAQSWRSEPTWFSYDGRNKSMPPAPSNIGGVTSAVQSRGPSPVDVAISKAENHPQANQAERGASLNFRLATSQEMKMGEIQRKILIGVGAVVLAMLIYPPYRIHGYGPSSNAVIQSGYAFLFDLPNRATVDVTTLLVQWIGVLIVGAMAFFLLKDK